MDNSYHSHLKELYSSSFVFSANPGGNCEELSVCEKEKLGGCAGGWRRVRGSPGVGAGRGGRRREDRQQVLRVSADGTMAAALLRDDLTQGSGWEPRARHRRFSTVRSEGLPGS